ncbi:hypothetical protein [Streptomyces sp. PU-14G]|uniref:hypothetical protein n=1 Tax=Streptomyces sp. PU-14G TaxID=2800808 RepID=UPI0034DE76E9
MPEANSPSSPSPHARTEAPTDDRIRTHERTPAAERTPPQSRTRVEDASTREAPGPSADEAPAGSAEVGQEETGPAGTSPDEVGPDGVGPDEVGLDGVGPDEEERPSLTPRQARRVRIVLSTVVMLAVAVALAVRLGAAPSVLTVGFYGLALILSGTAIALSRRGRTRVATAVLALGFVLVVFGEWLV